MTDERVGRVRFMDQQRVNLDGFAHEDVSLGLVAASGPHDPAPSLVVREGRVVEMDGRRARRVHGGDHRHRRSLGCGDD